MASKKKRKAAGAPAKKKKATKKRAAAKPAKKRAAAKKPAAAKKRAPAKKRPPKVAAPATPTARPTGPVVLDEVLEISLVDVSTIQRVQDRVARAQRDVDEDEQKQFPDPSLVVEAATRDLRREEDDTDENALPDLFAAEARRQKERTRDDAAAPKVRDGSLFGLVDDDGED